MTSTKWQSRLNSDNLFYPLSDEEWIEPFFASDSKDDAVQIFNKGMAGRFSIVGYEVNEVTPQPWAMRYALIKLFKGTLFNVSILLSATKEQLRAVDSEYNKLDEWVNCNRLYGARINKNGNILVSHPFEHHHFEEASVATAVFSPFGEVIGPLKSILGWSLFDEYLNV